MAVPQSGNTLTRAAEVEVGRSDVLRVDVDVDSDLRRILARLAKFGVRRFSALIDVVALTAALATGSAASAWIAVAALVTLAVNDGLHLYRSRISISLLDDAPRLVTGVMIGGATAAAISTATSSPLGEDWWIRVGIGVIAVLVGRGCTYTLIRTLRRRRIFALRTLIVGTDAVARHLAELMADRPAAGLRPVAFFDPGAPHDRLSGLAVHRHTTLEEATFDADASMIVIAFGDEPDYDSVQRVRDAAQLHAEILFVPRFHELQGIASPDMDHLYDVPLFRLRRWSHRTRAWKIKRAFDAVAAAAGIVVVSPVLAVAALAVRLTMGSPILFRQERIGLDGQPFTILKFRSLPNAPADISDGDWNSQITREPNAVGRFIRAASIDELPQLWNVLKGDMSLVGPRPERPSFVNDFTKLYPDYRQRHRVPVGITGLAQVEGLRGDTPIADRARFDNLYVENWSLWGDLKILLRTIGSVLRRKGS